MPGTRAPAPGGALVLSAATQFLVANQNPTEHQLEVACEQRGVDDPFFVQYGRFLWRAIHLDLGYSYASVGFREPVSVTTELRRPRLRDRGLRRAGLRSRRPRQPRARRVRRRPVQPDRRPDGGRRGSRVRAYWRRRSPSGARTERAPGAPAPRVRGRPRTRHRRAA